MGSFWPQQYSRPSRRLKKYLECGEERCCVVYRPAPTKSHFNAHTLYEKESSHRSQSVVCVSSRQREIDCDYYDCKVDWSMLNTARCC